MPFRRRLKSQEEQKCCSLDKHITLSELEMRAKRIDDQHDYYSGADLAPGTKCRPDGSSTKCKVDQAAGRRICTGVVIGEWWTLANFLIALMLDKMTV